MTVGDRMVDGGERVLDHWLVFSLLCKHRRLILLRLS